MGRRNTHVQVYFFSLNPVIVRCGTAISRNIKHRTLALTRIRRDNGIYVTRCRALT